MNPNTNTPSLPANAGQELGASGTYFFKGYVTAEEYSIDLQGKYGLQVYDVMRKSDATIKAALKIVKEPILGATWSIESASNEPADQEIANRANYEFFSRKFDFYNTQREGFTYLDMGFFVGEKVWEVAEFDGRAYIGLAKIASRKQRSILKWMTDDDKPGVTQILPSGGANNNYTGGVSVNIPRNKLMVVVNDQEGDNFFGVSLLRYVYKPWKLKDGLEIMNVVALENQGLGIPYIKKGLNGETVDENELAKLRTRLRQQRVNEEAFLEYPASVEVGWTDMKGNTTKEIIPTIEYQDRQILLSILAQFLLLGSADSAGSRAVSADHSRMFVKALTSVAKQWQIAFQNDVVKEWVDLNYSKDSLKNGYPKLQFSSISDEDVTETATALNSLMQVSAIHPDRDVENRLRKSLNLPELSDEDYENYDKNITAMQAKAQEVQDNMGENTNQPASGSPNSPDDQEQQLPDESGGPSNATQAIAQARTAQRKLLRLL